MKIKNISKLGLISALIMIVWSFKTNDPIQSELYKSLAVVFVLASAHLFSTQIHTNNEQNGPIKSN